MALKPCPECGEEVSTTAEACPKCGKPIKPRTHPIVGILAILFALFVIGMVMRACQTPMSYSG